MSSNNSLKKKLLLTASAGVLGTTLAALPVSYDLDPTNPSALSAFARDGGGEGGGDDGGGGEGGGDDGGGGEGGGEGGGDDGGGGEGGGEGGGDDGGGGEGGSSGGGSGGEGGSGQGSATSTQSNRDRNRSGGRGDDYTGGSTKVRTNNASQAQSAIQSGKARPLSQILPVVKRRYSGRVIGVDFRRRGKLYVYRIKVVQKSGRVIMVEVNAVNKSVLAVRNY